MSRAASVSPPERLFEPLRSPVRFREVMRRGERRTVGGLTVVSLAGVPPITRVGLVAGKRLGSAVVRNRIKRRTRHACRDVGLAPGQDYIVLPSSIVADVPYSTLVDWLQRAVERHD